MKEQKIGFWRDMYQAAKQGSVDLLCLQLLSLEAEHVNEFVLNQIKGLIKLAILKKREQEEKRALAYHRKNMRELQYEENQARARSLAAGGARLYTSSCVFWQQ